MNIHKSFTTVILMLTPFVAAAKQAPTTKADFHAEISQVYNFQPHALSHNRIQEKSQILDQFWAKAKSQRESYVTGLRQELADFSNPPFFLFDGSKLLLSLSSDPADRKIVLSAISHCDLRDLQLIDYFMLVHDMAARGEDTTAAAFHILEEPKFQIFIPQHSLTLAQNYSLVYMLMPTDQGFWIGPAIERLPKQGDETAQESLLLLLWYAQTPESDKAIREFSADTSKPNASRSYANELAHGKDKTSQAIRTAAASSNEQSLRDARRQRMKAVSDEALYDLDDYTLKIIAKRK
jgi:hypothetical protein